MAFEVGAIRQIRSARNTDVHSESLGWGSTGIAGITAFESTMADIANPVKWERLAKAIDGRNRLLGRTWRVYEVRVVFCKHGCKGTVNIAREFDAFVFSNKMSPNFLMVDRTATLHADECVVCGVDDEAMDVEGGVGVCI
jgi:hypothetical protein